MTSTLLVQALQPIPGALGREVRSLTLHGPRAREALKALLSVLLAVTVASLTHLDDLSWAAFSGYMVMRGDMAQTLPRGLNRIAGTIAGAVLGLLFAPAVADSPPLLVAFLFAASWIGVFMALTSRHSYAWMFFGLTAGMVATEALSSPATVAHFALTRVAEIATGTGACFLVASLFAGVEPVASDVFEEIAGARPWLGGLRSIATEDWLKARWLLIEHSTRAALAVAALPLVWRGFAIQDFSQTAVTSYVVMIVPSSVVRGHRHETIYERMAHRMLGCLLGSAAAIACIGLSGDHPLAALLALSGGVWLGHQIQTGREGISYLGTQFALGLLITLIQGPGPVTSILPGLERLLGIVIGSSMLCALILVWPLSHDN